MQIIVTNTKLISPTITYIILEIQNIHTKLLLFVTLNPSTLNDL
jgi:hypothetical protein